MIPRLKDFYENTIVTDIQKEFSLKNKLMVPKITKVILILGLGQNSNDKKILQNCGEVVSLISGQLPVITRFKKSISNFKTRKGMPAGVKVTLRKNRMYEFIDRLVNIALPRIKDFRGLSLKSFDKFGNYSLGIKEHVVFPEVNFDKVEKIRGLDISIVIYGASKSHSVALLEEFNFPFNKEKNN